MDRPVLSAYGWDDLRPDCVFELEWEDNDEEGGSRRKKPWRYRWPEATRDEILARLLDLNKTRAERERLAGPQAGSGRSPKRRLTPAASGPDLLTGV